uniref:Dolichyl-diphosphooligosaccharide--protein glycosyltransferase 48 kDa subunit n=1 Tax=Chenopodium quinoa TaxID=63459 RepID=A0A803LP26_CHEQI
MAKILTLLTILLLNLSHSLSFSPENPTNRRILVLLDDFAIKSSHSLFFDSLLSRNYQLDFKLADDPKLALQRYGQFLYDGLIIFAPYIDQCGVEFDDDPAAMVIDHTSYALSEFEGDHTLIASDSNMNMLQAAVLFQGTGHSVNPSNSHVVQVLSASPSAYLANPLSKLSSAPTFTGPRISLVSVVQARNNARILISGSLKLFSDRFLRSGLQKAGSSTRFDKSGNEQFVTELSKWIFHERGHLKAVNVRHHKTGQTDEPSIYRITDDLEYSVEIYEWSGVNWEPYVADDVQVQFYMMSPYVLKTLSTDKKGLYYTSFKVPDVYGVFQFKVEYQRLGYTSLSLAKQMAGFFVFTLVHLYSK